MLLLLHRVPGVPGAILSHTSKLLPSPNPPGGHQQPPRHTRMEQNVPFLQLVSPGLLLLHPTQDQSRLSSQKKPGMRPCASLGAAAQSPEPKILEPCSVLGMCHLCVTVLGQRPSAFTSSMAGHQAGDKSGLSSYHGAAVVTPQHSRCP